MVWENRDKIQRKSILGGLISLAVPVVISNLFMMVFEVVDMFWVGRLGKDAVAALSTGSFYVWMIRALTLTIAVGALAMVSRRSGERNKAALLETAGYALAVTIFFTVVMLFILFPVSLRIFNWLGLKTEIAQLSKQYIVIFLSGLFFVTMMVTCEHILRGIGNTVKPMLITGFAFMLNIILDPIFIFYFDLGLPGAAIATIISEFIGCVLMLGMLLKYFPFQNFFKMKIKYRLAGLYFIRMARIGLPVSFSGAMFSVIYLILSGILTTFGSEPIAAMGIGHRLEAFPYFFALGFSRATSTIVGQNLGAGNPERARISVLVSLRVVSIILLVVSFIFYFFGQQLYSIFISNTEVIEYGVHYLKFIAIFEVFLAFEVILEGAFSGAGDTKPPFLVIFIFTLLRIPLSILLGIHFDLGTDGVWFAISFTTFLKGVVLYYWFGKNKWMAKQV